MMISSRNQSNRGSRLRPRADPRPVKRSIAVAFAIIAAIAGVGVLLVVGPRSQTRVINCPFADVVSYLGGAFKTDLTKTGKHMMAWGPRFLDTETQYFVEPSAFSPGQELRFRAWYYQRGGEDNAFIIRRLNDSQTEITVDQVIRFLAFFPKCNASERKILSSIQQDLENESRTTGYDVKPGSVVQ